MCYSDNHLRYYPVSFPASHLHSSYYRDLTGEIAYSTGAYRKGRCDTRLLVFLSLESDKLKRGYELHRWEECRFQ